MYGKFHPLSKKCWLRLVHGLGPNTLKCRRFFGGFICFIRVFFYLSFWIYNSTYGKKKFFLFFIKSKRVHSESTSAPKDDHCYFWNCILRVLYACMHAESFQLCPILWDPMGCSLPGSSVHGILQARILKWLLCPLSRDLLDPGIKPCRYLLHLSSLAGRFFTASATWEVLLYTYKSYHLFF